MLFMREQRPNYADQMKTCGSADISRILGQKVRVFALWDSMLHDRRDSLVKDSADVLENSFLWLNLHILTATFDHFMQTVRTQMHRGSLWEPALINVVLSPQWKSLSNEEQAKYYEQADGEKRLHAQRHPDWTSCNNYVCTTHVNARILERVERSHWKSLVLIGTRRMGSLTCLFLCRE